jgi:predicted amidohydrolase
MNSINLTVIQLCSGQYKMTNLNQAEDLIQKACQRLQIKVASKANNEQLPHLLCLPEVFNFRCNNPEENSKAAEDIPNGITFKWASEICQKYKIWLVAGSILESSDDFDKPFNTSFAVSPQGELISKYRKINLFRLQLEDTPELCEPKFRKAGSEIANFETPFGKIGIAICFDLRFPEIFRQQRKEGCKLVVLPSAFTYKTGQAHWEILSMIIDPWGQVKASLHEENAGFTTQEIDLDFVQQVQDRLPMNL